MKEADVGPEKGVGNAVSWKARVLSKGNSLQWGGGDGSLVSVLLNLSNFQT